MGLYMSKKVYLAGAMQDSADSGVGWRERLTPKLEYLGFVVYNPCKSEANLADGTLEDAKEVLGGWLASGQKDKFIEHMRKVREDDLRMVRESELLIVYLDHEQRPGGTIAEMHEAFTRKIPLYVMSRDPLKVFNHWILATIWDGGELFDSWASLLEAVEKKYAKKIAK